MDEPIRESQLLRKLLRQADQVHARIISTFLTRNPDVSDC